MLESQIKFNESCKKQDEKAEKDRQKVADKTAKERFSVRQKQLRIELEEATTNHYKNLTSEEDFAQEVNNIRQRYWDDLLHNYQLTEELIYNIMCDINKSMIENVSSYINSTKDFKDYIEMWIHEVKIPISSLILMTHNHKNQVPKEYIEEIKRLDNYIDQILYYVRSN